MQHVEDALSSVLTDVIDISSSTATFNTVAYDHISCAFLVTIVYLVLQPTRNFYRELFNFLMH